MYPELAFYNIVRKLRVFSPLIIFLVAVLIFVLGFYGYYNSTYAAHIKADPTVPFNFDEMGAIYAIISMFLMESIDNPSIPNWQSACF
jgi:divalent metal cation (Fe/Co/Zn/Cd) transporter